MKEISALLAKADDCLESASYNFEGGFFDAAVNRSYYAVFDALSALLWHYEMIPKSHNGAKTLFAEHFIKTGIFPKESGIWMIYCYEMRQQSDYDFNSKIEADEVEKSLDFSKRFVDVIKSHLKGKEIQGL